MSKMQCHIHFPVSAFTNWYLVNLAPDASLICQCVNIPQNEATSIVICPGPATYSGSGSHSRTSLSALAIKLCRGLYATTLAGRWDGNSAIGSRTGCPSLSCTSHTKRPFCPPFPLMTYLPSGLKAASACVYVVVPELGRVSPGARCEVGPDGRRR